ILSHCIKTLERYKIPQNFIFTDSIPKNESGKIKRSVLKEIYSKIQRFSLRNRKSTIHEQIKKEQEVLGGKFKKENYISERIWATAHDGTKIPMIISYKKGTVLNGQNPTIL
ncbi:MAG: hypothetical protein COA57_14040, partial [Flavobacteriales bacterium]